MALLKPFRQVSENDVVNLFAFDGSAATRGAIVKLETAAAKAWKGDNEFDNVSINNSYPNTLSDRYSVTARVSMCGSGEVPFGMLMYDVAEYDENGEKLIWHPRKAHEMQVSLSGQAVPVLTRGIVLVNGIDTTSHNTVAVGAGVKVYAGGQTDATAGSIVTHSSAPVALRKSYLGFCVGAASANGDVLVKLEPRELD
jgi:hypothetical protein